MFDVLFKLKWFFKENRKRYKIALMLLLVTNVLVVLPPLIIGNIIDSIYLGPKMGAITLFILPILYIWMKTYGASKGTITIDGMDINKLPRQVIRAHMGIVLQDPYLFSGTVESNITLGDTRITSEKARQSLDAVGGDRVLKHLPNGIFEPVVEKGSTLSSGQRQLITFARALAFDPAILILDEATSIIDD